MEIDRQRDVLKRLSYIEGHVSGIRRMVEEDKYRVDILRQTNAVRKALENWKRLSWRDIYAPASRRELKAIVKRLLFRS